MEEGRKALKLGDEILGLALDLASLSLGGLGQCWPPWELGLLIYSKKRPDTATTPFGSESP